MKHVMIDIFLFPLQKQAQWLDISKGIFELTEWHLIAKEWFGEKPRNSEEVS